MSKPLTIKLQKELNAQINKLLGRAKRLYVVPLTANEIRVWWENMIDPDIVKAYHVLKDKHYTLYDATHEQGLICFMQNGQFDVDFKVDMLKMNPTSNYNNIPSSRTDDEIYAAWPYGVDRYEEFKEWMATVAAVNREFNIAQITTVKVIEMCKTLGQINRVFPELAQYMPLPVRDELHEQKRASGMPYGWAEYNKAHVEIARNALAKAHLMPDSTSGWDARVTWCKYHALDEDAKVAE